MGKKTTKGGKSRNNKSSSKNKNSSKNKRNINKKKKVKKKDILGDLPEPPVPVEMNNDLPEPPKDLPTKFSHFKPKDDEFVSFSIDPPEIKEEKTEKKGLFNLFKKKDVFDEPPKPPKDLDELNDEPPMLSKLKFPEPINKEESKTEEKSKEKKIEKKGLFGIFKSKPKETNELEDNEIKMPALPDFERPISSKEIKPKNELKNKEKIIIEKPKIKEIEIPKVHEKPKSFFNIFKKENKDNKKEENIIQKKIEPPKKEIKIDIPKPVKKEKITDISKPRLDTPLPPIKPVKKDRTILFGLIKVSEDKDSDSKPIKKEKTKIPIKESKIPKLEIPNLKIDKKEIKKPKLSKPSLPQIKIEKPKLIAKKIEPQKPLFGKLDELKQKKEEVKALQKEKETIIKEINNLKKQFDKETIKQKNNHNNELEKSRKEFLKEIETKTKEFDSYTNNKLNDIESKSKEIHLQIHKSKDDIEKERIKIEQIDLGLNKTEQELNQREEMLSKQEESFKHDTLELEKKADELKNKAMIQNENLEKIKHEIEVGTIQLKELEIKKVEAQKLLDMKDQYFEKEQKKIDEIKDNLSKQEEELQKKIDKMAALSEMEKKEKKFELDIKKEEQEEASHKRVINKLILKESHLNQEISQKEAYLARKESELDEREKVLEEKTNTLLQLQNELLHEKKLVEEKRFEHIQKPIEQTQTQQTNMKFSTDQLYHMIGEATDLITLGKYQDAKHMYNIIQSNFLKLRIPKEERQSLELSLNSLYNDLNLAILNQ